ncbi:hypothetical protein [Phyllobacterium endophyticum]|uniref:hypothetical protein n=1 Tax=Phyllobacterium endophyticum TaxID=1149773 RepID=UPI0011C75855|nr:hypothetical protein [Phyllobacterium endophyticum]TXR49549.1 hypothetical protein FVA77_09595 [Phyllobacterium endophyticum]
MTIPRPHHPKNHPDRFADCQRAIEDRLLELLGDATMAGWTRTEILAAIIEVADITSLAMHKNIGLSVEAELRKLKGKR